MRVRRVALVAALASVAAFAACTLNPQPLPPRDDFSGESTGADAGQRADASGFGSVPEVPPAADAGTGTPNLDDDGGDGGDRTDGGDGGDGSTDASDDGG